MSYKNIMALSKNKFKIYAKETQIFVEAVYKGVTQVYDEHTITAWNFDDIQT